ncbi:MAG TPA: Kdo hydroxylase family protein [Terriglobales bacterium]|nr:Kdo hydroxylase family protein [Terriglobales bacterium]
MTSASQTLNNRSWLQVEDYRYPGGWSVAQPVQRSSDYCRELEAGRILFFPGIPFALPAKDCAFLISQKQTGSRFHKNISYRPKQDILRGASAENPADQQRLHSIMREYSRQITQFTASFLAPYAGKLVLDFASFRPLEEQGRDLPLHKRNDLLHVDAFPTRPTRGARILRVFNNLNPAVPRIWRTGEPFHELAPRFAKDAGLNYYAAQGRSALFRLRRSAARVFRGLGLPLADRSAYDLFMLHFHDWLKENEGYQKEEHTRSEFPPGCTWMVYTDGVPHAALSGQYALEHTYIVPREALVAPDLAPISVLEKISGTAMT